MTRLLRIITGLLVGSTLLGTAAPVTFQVNMGAQIQRGAFQPSMDTVLVAGDAINSWNTSASPLTNSVTDTNIWLETFDVPGEAGTAVQYKFLFNSAANGLVWEGNVGAAGAQNRSFTLTGSDQTLPVVYFNNITNSTLVTTPVTFQVDMSVQMSQGTFDPASGTVSVAGDALNNWSTSASALTNNPAQTNIWLGTFPITEAPGSLIAYKFVMNGSTWESRNNRTFTLSNGSEVLPLVYFNDVAGAATNVALTFTVDMSVQAARGAFNPATDTVFAAGTFNGWDPATFQLTNSPTSTNVFFGTVTDSNDGPGATIQYKFLVNSSSWESTANRSYVLTSVSGPQSVPTAFFNDLSTLGLLSVDRVAGGQLSLSWIGGPGVRLQAATNLLRTAWQDIPNTAGQTNAVVPLDGRQSFYRLTGP